MKEQARKRDRAATRARLLDAAAKAFNRGGFDGTDSNRLARAAGYAPATFYQHFSDKRDCFLQVYEGWVAEEWSRLERVLEAGGSPERLARGVVDTVLDMHCEWSGLRAGLRALVASDETVRKFQRAQRRRQLSLLEAFRKRHATAARSNRASPPARRPRAEDALLLLTMERAADALADGEIEALELSQSALRAALQRLVLAHLRS